MSYWTIYADPSDAWSSHWSNAPKEEKEMKTIKIPKIKGDGNDLFPIKFYRSKSDRYNIYLQKQEIEKLVIPKGTIIDINWTKYYRHARPSSDEISIPIYYVNRMLKYIYLKNLRNGL